MKTLAIDIWSDVACPWCYVGKRRFEAALARFAHADAVEVTWRAFELDPRAPRGDAAARDARPYAARLAAKYGTSEARAEQMLRSMTTTAAAEGIEMDFAAIRPGNTFDAHRVLQLARRRGLGDAAEERLFAAYFTEGKAIDDRAVLLELAAELGLDRDEVGAMLASDELAAEVRAEERDAQALGIHGVPFFAIGAPEGRRYGISGAQPPEVLLEVLERAWDELPDAPAPAAPACDPADPDSCA